MDEVERKLQIMEFPPKLEEIKQKKKLSYKELVQGTKNYRSNFTLPQILEKVYNQNLENKVRKNYLVERGKNYPDGFQGIKIKKYDSIRDIFLVEIVDGENGQLFIKKYKDYFPTKQNLLDDWILGL